MNPFEHLPKKGTDLLVNWEQLWPRSYDKRTVNPYTRARAILMNGTEFENVWFSHQFQRQAQDNDLRRTLALLRRSEQQQQKAISHLKPVSETPLEHTIGYEQLAVDLTAHLAKRVTDVGIRNALNFALLEDFDHLYRYANYLDLTENVKAEELVGRYTEIMPGRPTIAHHRHPNDSVRFAVTNPGAPLFDTLASSVITAAEQQTMNYYMNLSATYPDETGRKLYEEIGMVEEQHVTQYGSLINPNHTWLENLLLHQYTECYLYWSCWETETESHIKQFWDNLFQQELAHLHIACDLLNKYEKKQWQQILPDGSFPDSIRLTENIAYVREVLANTVTLTAQKEHYTDVGDLPRESDFFAYQERVNQPVRDVVSHQVMEEAIRRNGTDYRFETKENPIPALRDRKKDELDLGRVPEASFARV